MKRLKVISEIALKLISPEDFDSRLNSVFAIIGEHLNVSRVYLFIDDEDGSTTSNTHEWCNEGIAPQRNALQRFPYSIAPSWRAMLLQKGTIFSENIRELPEDIVAILEPQEIKSLIAYPVFIAKEMKGFIGFDECRITRRWSDNELELLKTASGIISNALEKSIAEERLRNSENNFRNFFETIDDLFIIGNTHGDILYTNSAVSAKLGYTPGELQKMKIIDLHPDEKKEEASEIIAAMFRGERERTVPWNSKIKMEEGFLSKPRSGKACGTEWIASSASQRT